MSQQIHIVFRVLNFLFGTSPIVQTLTTTQKLVLICLSRHQGKKGIYPSISKLCQELNLSKWAIQRAIENLEEKEILKVTKQSGLRNQYFLYIPESTGSAEATSSIDATGSAHATGLVAPTHLTSSVHAPAYNERSNPVSNPLRERDSHPVDNFEDQERGKFLTKEEFIFTAGEMSEALLRDIHIQRCFENFLLWLHESKGRKTFKRGEWEKWFHREHNGKKAKPLGEVLTLPLERDEAFFEKNLAKHEIYKKAPMPEELKKMIRTGFKKYE